MISQENTNNVQREESQENNQQVVQEIEQPAWMFYQFVDPSTGLPIYQMMPEYIEYWTAFFQNIYLLRETVNKNWKTQQLTAYMLCLHDIQAYILNYIWTVSPAVKDFNAFLKAMEGYGQTVNKMGYQLYNHQNDYLEKKANGYDFKLDKKKKKENNKPEQKPKEKVKQKPKEEEIVVRKDDPTITAAELLKKEWESNKYTNMDSYHLQSANLIFIGHVDSGKSTLTGNIMKELKLVDQQELTKNRQDAKENHMESWQLAYIADIDPSEREKGKTLQCSKMIFSLSERRFTLFDAPGHKNYVPSMIMGACQSDIAVLIISSKSGQFQSGFQKEGQTKEHAMLAKALGVQTMIAAVTKMGTNQWNQARYTNIKTVVSAFLQNSCGFKKVQFIPIDSLNNQNIHSKYETQWYKGPCLMQVLNKAPIPVRDPDGPLRLPIIDKFKDGGQLYLYGKIQSGKIAMEGQVVSLLPSRKYVSIREIFNAKDQRLPYALAGQNVKLKVKGIQEDDVHRGEVICSNNNFCQESFEFKANLTVLQLPEQKKIMSTGYECIIHMHAIATQAEISNIEGKIQKTTGKTAKATFLRPGQQGKVSIKLRKSVCLQKFDFIQSLGRFTLRDQGKTIGYGEVTKIKPAKVLTKEQKDQLCVKVQNETTALTAEMQNVKVEEVQEVKSTQI